MTQEDKELLLKDLCARLPYGICANLPNHHLVSHKYVIYDINIQNGWTNGLLDCVGRIQIYSAKVEDIKPYLRPMSSMTEEERNKYNEYLFYGFSIGLLSNTATAYELINWLLEHHFDFMGLITKGLAIEVTEENNPYKE